MSEQQAAGMRTLAHEHLLLGATLGEVAGCEDAPISYAGEDAFGRVGCAVCDLTGLMIASITGADAERFVNTAFAQPPEQIGEARASAVLLGDGALASIAIVARTGDAEYLAFDLSARQDLLGEWLFWLSTAEQEGVRAFPACVVEDASELLVPLLLAGEAADRVLGDYLAEGVSLPATGNIDSLELDGRPCLVMSVPVGEGNAFLVLVPPVFAVPFWRSLMSFPEVSPLGRTALDDLLASGISWWQLLGETGKAFVGEDELVRLGLARERGEYVGLRGLRQRG